MAVFEYLALDANGKSRKGVADADSSRQIRALLRTRGLFPVEVHRARETGARIRQSMFRPRVSAASLALLTRQLATMVRAGLPLEQALRALGEQVGGTGLQAVVAGVREQISEGAPLHEALGRYPTVFPELYRVMVEAGESSGRLEEVLERLADYTGERQNLRQTLSVALIYPGLVTVVAVLVITALLTYVVPEVVRVFEQTGQQLPFLTVALIATSDFIRAWGVYLVLGLVMLMFLVRLLLGRPWFRWHWDRVFLKVPLLGRFNRMLNAARFARTLAILTESGVPLLDALQIGARTVRNLHLNQAVTSAALAVREGGKLHSALQEAGCFPPLMIHMLAAGEESGELENMLERAASYQEKELAVSLKATTALIEPLMILLMGAVVLLIVLAVLLPIFEMNQLIGK